MKNTRVEIVIRRNSSVNCLEALLIFFIQTKLETMTAILVQFLSLNLDAMGQALESFNISRRDSQILQM